MSRRDKKGYALIEELLSSFLDKSYKELINLFKLEIFAFLFIFSGLLYGQIDEITLIKSPFQEGDFEYEAIIPYLFPNSSDFPDVQIPDSELFEIPSKENNKLIENSAVQYFFRKIGENDTLNFKSFSDSIINLNLSAVNYSKFLDIDNDGILEGFIRSITPWGSGTSYIMYWKKVDGLYKYQNAFWGDSERINVNSGKIKSFLVLNGFESDSTIHQLQEIDLPSCEVISEINFSRFLSIPEETLPTERKMFKTIEDTTKLRLWTESIDKGIYNKDHQIGANGNIQCTFSVNSKGTIYSKFFDKNSKIWYLVSLDNNNQISDYIYWPNHKEKGLLLGWLDEYSIKITQN